jgi:hypothetical protein
VSLEDKKFRGNGRWKENKHIPKYSNIGRTGFSIL